METEKAISINFTDLQDTPNVLIPQQLASVSADGKGIIFTDKIKLLDLVNAGHSSLEGNLRVVGICDLENDVNCKTLRGESLTIGNIYCAGKLKVGDISNDALQTTGLETSILSLKVSKSVDCQHINSHQINSENMETQSLIIHKDLRLPTEVNIDSLNVKSFKVLETSYLNKVLSTEQTCISLNSQSALITDFTSTNALIVDMKATKIESDEIVSGSIHHKTSDIDGTPEQPDIKDLDGGYYQRMLHSSKYIWYGKIKSPSKSIKIKINTETPKVLSQIIPRVSFHIYDMGGLDLISSFKHDTQIFLNQNDDTSFFVNLTFSENVPLIAKFIFSIVLEKV